jgi:hypothetical protein
MTNDALELSPKLPRTPGWVGLSEERKKWLQQETSDLNKLGMAETHIGVTSALKLLEVEAGLKGTSMSMDSYLEFAFPHGKATGNRRLKGGRQLIELWGRDICNAIVRKGETLLRGSLGIGLNELVNVAKALPAPTAKDDKTIEGFFEKKVRPALQERRVGRQQSKSTKLTYDQFIRNLFNTGRLYKKQTKGLNTSADHKEALKTVVGWWMEDWAVPGTLECKRLAIPEGIVATVGRPRKKGK